MAKCKSCNRELHPSIMYIVCKDCASHITELEQEVGRLKEKRSGHYCDANDLTSFMPYPSVLCSRCRDASKNIHVISDNKLHKQVAKLRWEVERLRFALEKYGCHDPDCIALLDDESDQVLYDFQQCTCGLEEALQTQDGE